MEVNQIPSSLNYNFFYDNYVRTYIYIRTPTRLHYPARLRAQVIRNAVVKNPGLQEALTDSMQPPLCLLTEINERLKLKDKPVEVVHPCTNAEIDELWNNVQQIVTGLRNNGLIAGLAKIDFFPEMASTKLRYCLSKI